MHVTIDLPEILDIPDQGWVAIVKQFAKNKGGHHTGFGIAIPIGGRTELDSAPGENIHLALSNSVYRGEVCSRIDFRRAEYPGTRQCRKVRRRDSLSPPQAGTLPIHCQYPREAVPHLRQRHAAQAVKVPLPAACLTDSRFGRSCGT